MLRAPGARAEHVNVSHSHGTAAAPKGRFVDGRATNERLMRHDPPRTTLDGLVNRPDW
ncbi:MAG: hypothetical protein U0235_20375 [Polyangiaceae bacterium]